MAPGDVIELAKRCAQYCRMKTNANITHETYDNTNNNTNASIYTPTHSRDDMYTTPQKATSANSNLDSPYTNHIHSPTTTSPTSHTYTNTHTSPHTHTYTYKYILTETDFLSVYTNYVTPSSTDQKSSSGTSTSTGTGAGNFRTGTGNNTAKPVKWSQIGGYKKQIKQLTDVYLLPRLYKRVFKYSPISLSKAALLYGPTGCGGSEL